MSQRDETPLSDLIADLNRVGSRARLRRLVEAFQRSSVGVVANGVGADTVGEIRTTVENPVALGVTRHGGETRILTFADPHVFAARFGRQFNAELSGASVMETVLANPSCSGVLVNSATAQVSAVIARASIEELMKRGESKPWWKVW